MPSNVEIKARIPGVEELLPRAAAIADSPREDIHQDDTFFRCDEGRLKLRDFGDGHGQLIFYRRADEAGPKPSFYRSTPTDDPDGMRETLTLAYGARGRVRKHRILFLAGRTRIHLDRVDGLGDHLELEVVLEEEHPDEAAIAGAVAEAHRVMTALGVDETQLVEGAYLDLLAA